MSMKDYAIMKAELRNTERGAQKDHDTGATICS